MLGLGLAELERAGSLKIQRAVSEDDPLWAEAGLGLGGPVSLDLRARITGAGQVLVTGVIEVPVVGECRRCLADVRQTFRQEVALVWSEPAELAAESDGEEEIRTLDPGASEIDLGEAIREELILSAPAYLLCRDECKGLCPQCGANLNDGPCGCETEEQDPRWEALRALKKE